MNGRKDGGKDTSKYKNKTWSRDGAKSADKSKKDLQAFINKMVKKELNLLGKGKKKRDLNALDEGEVPSDDDESLANFDYSILEGMDLGSDTESEN